MNDVRYLSSTNKLVKKFLKLLACTALLLVLSLVINNALKQNQVQVVEVVSEQSAAAETSVQTEPEQEVPVAGKANNRLNGKGLTPRN